MTLTIEVEAPPLTQWDDGSIRVVGTRVLLEIIVNAYKNGDSPEEIAYSYPSISLKDTYAVIAYYLNHKDQVELYLAEVERQSEEIRKIIEARTPPLPGLRAMLLERSAKLEVELHAIAGSR